MWVSSWYHIWFIWIIFTSTILFVVQVNCNAEDTNEYSPSRDFNYYNDKINSNYDYDYLSDVNISSDELRINNDVQDKNKISPVDRLHECGLADKCPENATTLVTSPSISLEICRCDVEKCLQYGDCCWPLIENRTLPESRNLWHCHRLENQNTSITYSLMVSECPESSKDAISKRLCSGQNIPPQNYTYLIDLPVYSSKTEVLYKNIYCARCHDEKSSNILQWTMHLACNEELSPEKRNAFLEKARYIPGERLWQSPNDTSRCGLRIDELKENEIINHIPNVRFCPGKAIDTCSANFGLDEVGGIHDVGNGERIRKLCSSYSQFVMNKVSGKVYKNPHCALCYENTNEQISLSCRKPNIGTTFFKVRPGETGAILPSAGLNFLFDFGLNKNEYVGYEMLCGEDEIWDYIRQKCGPMICRNGYVLKNGNCVKKNKPEELTTIGNKDSSTGDGELDSNENEGNNGTFSRDGQELEQDPECSKYRILLHEHEYKLLSNPKNSISITLPNDEEPYILSESEYEHVNETTISICAKYLHHAFRPTFSTTLNYLSLISVGCSVIFLSFHIILYLLLDKLRNPPGRNLFYLTLSLFIFQFLFLTMFTHDRWAVVCVGAAIIMHYFSLVAFFWMNIMSFDMWRTFSGNTLLRRSHSTDSQKFVKYSLFAWLTPLLIVSIAMIFDFGFPAPDEAEVDAEDSTDDNTDLFANVRPSYGENGLCWITQRFSLFIFFALPVALVIITNFILFTCTAAAILSQQKESSRIFKNKPVAVPKSQLSTYSSSTSTTNNTSSIPTTTKKSSPTKSMHATNRDKIRLMLYINMALIMGLAWTLGFVSQFLASDWLRYPFVIINGLQGTFIFFAFDFKWKIYKMLKDLIYDGKLGKMFGLERSTSSIGVDNSNRRGTISNSGTKSTNMMSSVSDDEKIRRMSLMVNMSNHE